MNQLEISVKISKEHKSDYYWRNREKRLKYWHDRYETIKDDVKEYNKEYYRTHSEFIKFKNCMKEKPEKKPAEKKMSKKKKNPFTHLPKLVEMPIVESPPPVPIQKAFPSQLDNISITFD